jgi:hypothetical protein
MTNGSVLKTLKVQRDGFRDSFNRGDALRNWADRFAANEEPSIDELMGDPIMDALLARDGLQRDVVNQHIAAVRARLT